jgi:hypothetical protein
MLRSRRQRRVRLRLLLKEETICVTGVLRRQGVG